MSESTGAAPSYGSPEAYTDFVKTLHAFTSIVLFQLLDDSAELRDRVIRNFIARGMTCVESVEQLWHLKHYQDCYVLYRCLLDRLFHLHVLDRDDAYVEFDNSSFLEQFKTANYPRGQPGFKDRKDVHDFAASEKARYRELTKSKPPKWRIPDPLQVAKDMDLEFLYHLGYAHASQHVHPMSNDGEEDLERMLMLRTEPRFDQRSVLSNAILAQLLLTRNGLSASSFDWRRVIGTFLDESIEFLKSGRGDYNITFMKIASQGPDFSWAKKAGETSESNGKTM
ncbi:DUF5677 domain-containing protein [Candidatus Bipolaricaulota bacterium]